MSKNPPPPPLERDAYKVSEVAVRLSCSPQTIHRLIREGEIKAFTFAGITRVKKTEVDALMSRGVGRRNPRTGRPRKTTAS